MTFIHVADIVTSDISYVIKQYIYLFVIYVIYVKLFIYLHSAMRMMRYNLGKIVVHDYTCSDNKKGYLSQFYLE